MNKWRLVIEYRYVNSPLKGHEFLLPVIEDMLLGQGGNHPWSIIDFEDGYHQMPLEEGGHQYTAFCTPFGVYEWRVLPMCLRVGLPAFQRMVANCLRFRGHHNHPYVDDILTGTRPVSRGKGKVPDSQAYD